MKHAKSTRFPVLVSVLLVLAACGGGGSSSSGSDASAINVWLGKWGLTGAGSTICSNRPSAVGGEFNFSQAGSGINGNYSVSVTCVGARPPVSVRVGGTVSSTSISRDKLVLVDDENDTITFTRTAGEVFGMKIVDPDSGHQISAIAIKK